MTKRIKYLLVLNVVLLALVSLALQRRETSSTLDGMATAFALRDTAQLGAVRMGSLILQRQQGVAWGVNKKYLASPNRIAQLLSMLPRLEVKRPAPERLKPALQKAFDERGFLLEMYSSEGLMKKYPVVSFEGEAYAMLEADQPYAIYVPGYRENVADWLSPNNVNAWRDKHVLYATWRTLKKLNIEVPERPEQNLEVYFNKDFYAVKGVDRLDSAKLYGYISQYVQFEALTYLALPESSPIFQGDPAATIRVEDLSRQQPAVLELYPRSDSLYGLLQDTGETVLLDPRAMANILQPPSSFIRK